MPSLELSRNPSKHLFKLARTTIREAFRVIIVVRREALEHVVRYHCGSHKSGTSFARLLADRARDMKSPNFDGVVPISHTELGRDMKANNVELVLRTLAGFIVHSNVAFSVLLDDGDGAVSERLYDFMKSLKYPIAHCRNKIVILGHSSFESELEIASKTMRSLATDSMKSDKRTLLPLSELCVALQCGE